MKLEGDDHAHQQPNYAPKERGDEKLTNGAVIEFNFSFI